MDTGQTQFVYTKLDEGISEADCSRFVVQFVDMFYPILNLDISEGLPGAPSYPPREMFKLVIYAFYRGITSVGMLAEMDEFHQIFVMFQEILNLLVGRSEDLYINVVDVLKYYLDVLLYLLMK